MVPSPVALGLTLCDYVIIEEGTRKISLVGSFREIEVTRFPTALPPFFVCSALTDGSGDGTLELVLSRLETDEELFVYHRPITLSNQLAELRVQLRIRNCSIPAAGYYQFTLLVDGQWVAQRRFRVYSTGG